MLPSIISVTQEASDLTLLTIDELRSAAGIADGSKDAALTQLGTRVADVITQACKVATDGATPPTLRQEVLTETFRLNHWWNRRNQQSARETLILARRPIVSVQSIVEAGNTLDSSDYEIHASAGTLIRLFNDAPSHWARDKIVVSYTAGWDIVPQGLKRAAERLVQLYWFEIGIDPAVRQENVAGVYSQTRWIGSVTDPSIPQEVMDDLGPYINPQA